MSLTKIAGGLIISVIALMSFSASAGPVNVDINVVVPGVYQEPQPVYVLPGPVYQAAPVYIQQQPVYIEQEEQENWYWDCKKNKCKQKKSKKEKHHKHDRDDD